MQKVLLVAGLALTAACGDPLDHSSAWDPFSPAEKQAKGSVRGTVLLEGESDHAGVSVQLQNEARTYTAQTGADGSFRITGIVPGSYAARISTRYFAEVTRGVDVALGGESDLRTIDVQARRASVRGSATLEKRINGAAQLVGGVLLTLVRTASIRGAAQGAPRWRAAAGGTTGATGPAYTSTSDGAGDYVFTGVPAGEYVITGAGGGAEQDGGTITVTGEEGVVDAGDLVVRPVSGFFLISGSTAGAVVPNTYNDPAITLLVSESNAATMAYGVVSSPYASDCAPGAPGPVQSTVNVTLLAEGYHTICMIFFDDNGGASETVVRQLVLDSVAPVAGTPLINGGAAATNNPDVSLSLPANGATQAYLSLSGCRTGAAWQDYSPLAALSLGSTQGNRTVYVAFRDDAGNETAGCVTAGIRLDTAFTSALSFNLQTLDAAAVPGKTALPRVHLLIGGIDADSAEMQIGGDLGFAGAAWQAAASPVTWPLPAGDGPKTLYLRARDGAGNLSATFSRTITLDQTGPEAPGLSLTDNGADGFALDATTVELRWTQPAGAQRYELERYVVGSDALFGLRYTGPSAGADRFTDDTAATMGLPHYYRVRALDDLGNASGWSLAVVAFPFAPVERLSWYDTAAGTLLTFAPARGTFNLRSFLRAYGADGGISDLFLPDNVTSYIDTRTGVSYNDALVLRASNSDGSLVWESTVSLAAASRASVVVAHPDYNGFGFAEDASGAVHGLYVGLEWPLQLKTLRGAGGAFTFGNLLSPFQGMLYNIGFGTARSGAVVACGNMNGAQEVWCGAESDGVWTMADTGLGMPGNFFYKEFAVGATSTGAIHTVAQTFLQQLVYLTNEGGAWSSSVIDAAAGTGVRPSLAVDAGDNVHIVYVDGGAGQLRYGLRPPNGGWTLSSVGAAGTGGAAIAVDASATLHVVYADGANLRHATKPALSGSWTIATAAAGTAPERTAIGIDKAGTLHVAYLDSPGNLGLAELWYVAGGGSGWSAPAALDTSASINTTHRLLISVNGTDPAVVYADQASEIKSLALRRRTRVTRVGAAGDGGRAGQIKPGPGGALHAAYYRPGVQQIWYAAEVSGAWQRSQVAGAYLSTSGITDYMPLSLAIDANGKAHVSYGDAFNGNRAQYATNATGGWVVEQIEAANAAQQMTSIAVAADGTPHVVYHVNECCGSGQIRYANRAGGTWQVTGLSDSNVYSKAIALDAAGFVHLVYDTGGFVVYRDNTGGSFDRQVISGAGNLGASLALDASGKSHVVYYQEYPHAVKYVNNVGGAWVTQTVDNCYCRMPKIAVAAGGTVFITVENGAQGRRVRFITNAGGGWTAVDANITAWGRDPSVGFLADGTPMLGYFDSANADYRFAAGLFGVSEASSIVRTTPF